MANFRSLSELVFEVANQVAQVNAPDGTALALTFGSNQPFGNQQPIRSTYFTWGFSTWGIDTIGPGDSPTNTTTGGGPTPGA